MMVLFGAPASPFARKVRIGADILGLSETLEITAADILDPNDRIRIENPLGKLPALVLDDGPVVFDSAVILEYLDHRAGGSIIIPPPSDARFRVLTAQALADGLMEAAVLQIYEGRFREPDKHCPRWLDHQAGKVTRALAAFERKQPPDDEITVASIALACALGYLDFRFEGRWRDSHPRLVAWLATFADRVPSFEQTRPVG